MAWSWGPGWLIWWAQPCVLAEDIPSQFKVQLKKESGVSSDLNVLSHVALGTVYYYQLLRNSALSDRDAKELFRPPSYDAQLQEQGWRMFEISSVALSIPFSRWGYSHHWALLLYVCVPILSSIWWMKNHLASLREMTQNDMMSDTFGSI